MPVGPYARLAFAFPAALLLFGAYVLIAEPGCASGPVGSPPGIGIPQCPGEPPDNVSCGGSSPPPLPAPMLGDCPGPAVGLSIVATGLVAVPLAYLFYRSRHYTPLPP